jgi:hypothetical protein
VGLGFCSSKTAFSAHGLGWPLMVASPRVKYTNGTVGCRKTRGFSFHLERRRACGRQRACWSAAPRTCAIYTHGKGRETLAHGARQSDFYQKTLSPDLTNSGHSVRALGRFRTFFRNVEGTEAS